MADSELFVVSNIPKEFEIVDLRSFFGDFIELERFDCFHFKNRKQTIRRKKNDETTEELETLCCIIRLKREHAVEFVQVYNKKQWQNADGNFLQSTCIVSRLSKESDNTKIRKLPELNTPIALPYGNVGTSTAKIRESIRLCKISTRTLKRMNIQLFDTRGKYSEMVMVDPKKNTIETKKRALVKRADSDWMRGLKKSRLIDDNNLEETLAKDTTNLGPDEWETYENDHIEEFTNKTFKTHTTEREEYLYEEPEEVEITWEKGGSGLVFYTDAIYWEKQKGLDFDEQTVEDYGRFDYVQDHDRLMYCDKCNGMASDTCAMEHQEMLRSVEDDDARNNNQSDESDTEPADHHQVGSPKMRRSATGRNDATGDGINLIDRTHKGVGERMSERILKNSGWEDGKGIGKDGDGITRSIFAYRRTNRVGLGHSLERFCRSNAKKASNYRRNNYHGFNTLDTTTKKKPTKLNHFISTIYDEKIC
eukprot:TRINITY_DN7346_c0_g1_i1.p1 TRINITY_DN7346_c0_g1~~TRINITY_DN7346_c0_g1_i1.p1  ORF type:complete len:478 (+),score=116.27 TRINITY_DN7346_c0_g1_i1:139-1572(+)